jgi:hypothetical protein
MTVRLENTVQDMEQPVPVNDAIALLLALDGANATQLQRRGYNVAGIRLCNKATTVAQLAQVAAAFKNDVEAYPERIKATELFGA